MYESIIAEVQSFKSVEFSSPEKLTTFDANDEKPTIYYLKKGAQEYIHKRLGLKVSASKVVYKKNETIWHRLADYCLDEVDDEQLKGKYFNFTKNNMVYITDKFNNVIDVYEGKDIEDVSEMDNLINNFNLYLTTSEKSNKFYTDGKGGVLKFICYESDSIQTDDYTPVIILELNTDKSRYKCYLGILIYKTFTLLPSTLSTLDTNSYCDFVKYFNAQDLMDKSKELGLELYSRYKMFVEKQKEVSVREIVSILKKAGYSLTLKDERSIDKISDMIDEESNDKIQTFFNTFEFKTGESAYDVLRLSQLKQIFRYNKLTLLDVLTIMSKEYLQYEGSKIDCDLLASIEYKLLSDTDLDEVQSIESEMSE